MEADVPWRIRWSTLRESETDASEPLSYINGTSGRFQSSWRNQQDEGGGRALNQVEVRLRFSRIKTNRIDGMRNGCKLPEQIMELKLPEQMMESKLGLRGAPLVSKWAWKPHSAHPPTCRLKRLVKHLYTQTCSNAPHPLYAYRYCYCYTGISRRNIFDIFSCQITIIAKSNTNQA
eukprot:364789-Chlamydomonas_euryale.AAC.2